MLKSPILKIPSEFYITMKPRENKTDHTFNFDREVICNNQNFHGKVVYFSYERYFRKISLHGGQYCNQLLSDQEQPGTKLVVLVKSYEFNINGKLLLRSPLGEKYYLCKIVSQYWDNIFIDTSCDYATKIADICCSIL